jgi:two-component system LytT family response regulator
MDAIRVCIVDDEKLARRAINKLLKREKSITVVGEASNGSEAVALIRERRPDIVFLDVRMPGIDGFEVLKQLDLEDPPLVVFVTAHDVYAIRAFEVQAIDYLLKPFDDETFHAVLARAKEHVIRTKMAEYGQRLAGLAEMLRDVKAEGDHAEYSDAKTESERLAIRCSGQLHLLVAEEIDWIEAAEHYSQIHAGQQKYLVRESISQLELRLPSRSFCRIHRSTIVNVARVEKVVPVSRGDYEVVLKGGVSLRMSRSRSKTFMRQLDL